MATYPYYTEPTHDRSTTVVTDGGARDTAVSSAESRLVVDAVDKIFLLEPNKHPLVSLLTNVGKVWDGKAWTGQGLQKAPTGNPEFQWYEDVYGGRYARAASSQIAGAGTCVVTGAGSSSAYIFTIGDVVRNARTGENYLVTAIAGANTITITNSYGDTPAAAIAAGDGLFIIGNVSSENAGARNVNTTRSTKCSNYTQIFKTSIAVTGTEKAAKLYGGADLPYLRAKKGTEHVMDIERAFWFGQKLTETSTYARRATGGIDEFITGGNSYVQNQGGPITAPDFNTFLREGFTYGNSQKLMFAGGIVLQAISEMSRGQLSTTNGDKTYGVKIQEWITPFGVVNLVHNPLFVDDYAGYAYLLDMECFTYRFMDGRDTKLETNVQANDVDGEIDQYITECGLERKQAPRHALLKGVTI